MFNGVIVNTNITAEQATATRGDLQEMADRLRYVVGASQAIVQLGRTTTPKLTLLETEVLPVPLQTDGIDHAGDVDTGPD